jgi:RND family efflux transporter MFP subunit
MSVTTLPGAPAPDRTARPNRWGRAVVTLLLVAAGVAAGAVGATLLAPTARKTEPAEAAPPKEEPKTVSFAREKWESSGIRTEPAAPAPLADFAWRTGRVVLDDSRVARVSPPVEGVVVEVRAQLGQDVKAGDVLAVIDSREVGAAKLEFVRARLAAAAERERAGWSATSAANTADLVKAVAADKSVSEIEAAFKDRPVGERRQTLLTAYTHRNQLRAQVASMKASAGVVAESTLRKAEAEADAAEASLRGLLEEYRVQSAQQARQAELKVKEADAALAAGRTHLLTLGFAAAALETLDPAAEGAAAARYEIRAPFAGTVVERRGVRSERVGPTVEMFRLADLSAVWVQADAFEADLPLLRALGGRGVVFRAPAAGVAEQSAQLVYAGDIVDRASRALTVTASAPNPRRELKPGMYVEVGLPRGGSDAVLQVPASAVQRHEGKTFVFVHTGGDEFCRKDVTLGREGGDRVEVKAGLAPGDAVAVEGGFVLKSELLRDQLAGE